MDIESGGRCFTEAKDFAQEKIDAGQGNSAMGTDSQVWSSGNVYLWVGPEEQLTWNDWSFVLVMHEDFLQWNDFRGTDFVILKEGLEGHSPVGRGYVLQQPENTTVATNMSSTAFPDPYDIHLYGLTIEFYAYRGSISPTAMEEVITAASQDSLRHIRRELMTDPSYSYSAGGVNLFLTPSERLTWSTWSLIPRRIQQFVTENGLKGTQFQILRDGVGPIGSGQIVSSTGAPTDVA